MAYSSSPEDSRPEDSRPAELLAGRLLLFVGLYALDPEGNARAGSAGGLGNWGG